MLLFLMDFWLREHGSKGLTLLEKLEEAVLEKHSQAWP